MTPNTVARALAADEPVYGAWVESTSPRAADVLAASGLDWLAIDMEHTPADFRTVETILRGVDVAETTPLVRLSSVEHAIQGGCKRALDAGARGLIVPQVETPEQAARVVAEAKFPPAGTRGVAGSVRANGYGTDFDQCVSDANAETLVVVQLETTTAVERADVILAVDGIDVAFVGENDLSASYGHPGEKNREDVRQAVSRVRRAAEANDVYAGLAGRTPEKLAERLAEGFRFFLLGGDLSLLRDGIAARLPDDR